MLVLYPLSNNSLGLRKYLLYFIKTVLEDRDMPYYVVTLTDYEVQELKALVQKGGKGCHIGYAQILLELDQRPENRL